MAFGGHLVFHSETIRIPGLRIAPTASVQEQYQDRGDIFILKERPTRECCVQVKGLKRDFTCREDWPWKELPHVFVARKEPADREWNRTDIIGYVTVNRALTHAHICDPRETRHLWYPVTYLNKNTGNQETSYACPVEHLEFIKLEGRGE
jgi:hypothetical protein